MEDIIQELHYSAPQAAPAHWPGDPKNEVEPANVEPLLPSVAATYTPRKIITPSPELEPRQHLQQSPVYLPRDTFRVQPKLAPQQTYTEQPKIAPRKTVHDAPRQQADPWALLPDSDIPAAPDKLSSTAKSQATLPGETHAVAGTKQRASKTMLDLFV